MIRRFTAASALLMSLALPARALQPLPDFLKAARAYNPDAAEARAGLRQQAAQAEAAEGRALPGLSARGSYTRNQYETTLTIKLDPDKPAATVTLLPHDQLDGVAQLTVPLVDLSSFKRIEAARTGRETAEQQVRATEQQLDAHVVQGYYQLVANLALLRASQKSLDVSRASLALTEQRKEAGSAAGLDVERARAEVERQVQQVASADLGIVLAARALRSATGVEPEVSAEVPLQDDLHEEADLPRFEERAKEQPAVAAAQLNLRAAEEQAQAQRLSLLPALSGTFAERFTNAPGFVGHELSWQAVLALSWNADLTSLANIRAQDAAAGAARARLQRAEIASRDAIHAEWSQVRAAIAKSRSARAQARAAALAADLARDRYQAGVATQLDLLQAQRDSFSAEVARIQADADLANARAQLRISSGQPLEASR